jgi:uncharacterized protein (TIGR03066 family)
MNLPRSSVLLVGCLAFVAATAAGADDKAVEKDKLLGTWQVTKSKGLPPEATVQFGKDGKLKLSAKDKVGKTISVEGTYSLEGDKLTVTTKQGEKESKETMTIKTLTDKKLVTVDPKGNEDEFEKK